MKLTHITIEDENGNIGVRWMKPDNVPHRAMFECGADIDWMFEKIRKDRAAKGFTLNADDLEKIKAVAAVTWTQEQLDGAAERKAKAAADAKEEQEAAEQAAAEREAEEKAKFDAAVAAAVARQS